MLVAIGDTHRSEGHGIEGAALEAVENAELVIHTGDFTTAAVLDAFEEAATDLAAVSGNNDDAHVRERLPETRVVSALERRFVVAHGHGRNDTALGLLARQEDADAVIVGHSHKPGIRRGGAVPIVNPGSHADPRWYRPGFATFERDCATVRVRIHTPAGELLETVDL